VHRKISKALIDFSNPICSQSFEEGFRFITRRSDKYPEAPMEQEAIIGAKRITT
jgi:hypothetical protein